MKKIKENLSLITVSVATLIYLLFIFKLTDLDQISKLSPNEVGDYLAGVFAPLAFLWLVFGYYQQGRELKLNTKALELQAKELQISNESLKQQVKEMEKSVEAQRNLFELTQLQYQNSIEEKLESQKPKIRFLGDIYTCNSDYAGSYEHRFNLKILNAGERISNIVIISNNWTFTNSKGGKYDNKKDLKVSVLDKNEELDLLFYLSRTVLVPFKNDILNITYTYTDGNQHHENFKLDKNNDGFVVVTKNIPHH